MVVTNVIPQKEIQCYPIEIDDENGSGTVNLLTCQKNETLEYSLNHGIVITNILQELFPNLSLIQPLVAFSLIIAFLTLGSGYLDTVFSFGQGFLNLINFGDVRHEGKFFYRLDLEKQEGCGVVAHERLTEPRITKE